MTSKGDGHGRIIRHKKFTPAPDDSSTLSHKKAPFLEALKVCRFTSQAAESVGISRNTVYKWREADPSFREAMDEIEGRTVDTLRAEAFRRGVDGVDRPIFGTLRGPDGPTTGVVGYVKEYSDTLLSKMLEAKDPAFRQGVTAQVHISFVQVVVGKLQSIIQRVVPLSCPHCKKPLSVRKDFSAEVSRLDVIDVTTEAAKEE